LPRVDTLGRGLDVSRQPGHVRRAVREQQALENYGLAKVACASANRGPRRHRHDHPLGLYRLAGRLVRAHGVRAVAVCAPPGKDVIDPAGRGFPCAVIDVRDLAA
jgi:hypothetical protein